MLADTQYKFDLRASDIDQAIMMLENIRDDEEFTSLEVGDSLIGLDLEIERLD